MNDHKCDTCTKDIETCDAKQIQWGIDIDPSAIGKAADRVVECDAYKQASQPLAKDQKHRQAGAGNGG